MRTLSKVERFGNIEHNSTWCRRVGCSDKLIHGDARFPVLEVGGEELTLEMCGQDNAPL